MQCMNHFWLPISPLSINKAKISSANPSNYEPRTTQLSCCSKSYAAAETDEIGQKSLVKAMPLPHHVQTITSTSNPFVKHCLKLRQSSSYRHFHGSVLLVGSTPIREVHNFQGTVQDEPSTIECLLVLDNLDIPEDLDNHSIRHVNVSSTVMKKLSGLQSIDCVDLIAVIRIPSTFHNVVGSLRKEDFCTWFLVVQRILVLDGIQDPGNLGTLLRSALAFKWDGVFLLSGCCDPFNEKALRASRGASFQLPIVSGEWADLEALKEEHNMRILAGHPANSGQAKPVSSLSQSFADSLADTPLCLVLGSEGSGLSKKSVQECELISIPMAGNFESLNVSVAGGIFLYMLQPKNRSVD